MPHYDKPHDGESIVDDNGTDGAKSGATLMSPPFRLKNLQTAYVYWSGMKSARCNNDDETQKSTGNGSE
jgi:hypothetical protein